MSRVLSSLGTLVFVILFNFFLFRLLPGDPIALYTRGRNVDPEIRRQMQAKLHAADRRAVHPVHQESVRSRAARHSSSALRSGTSSSRGSGPRCCWSARRPSSRRSSASGSASAAGGSRGERFDKVSTTTTLVLYSMPEFWFGMIMLIVFSVGVFGFLGSFPSAGCPHRASTRTSFAGMADVAWHLMLPVMTLTVIYLAEYSLVMRASLIDERGQDYLQTARAKGLRDDEVRRKHAVPNAMLPTTTLIFLNLGFVIGGAITIEYVFSLSGLGSLTVHALRGPDIPLLQTLFLLFSAAVILANLVADLLYGRLDPRVRT